MNTEELVMRLISLMRRCRELPGAPVKLIEDTESLGRANEWSVALETLCLQLYDAEIEVPIDLLDEIAVLGHQLKLAPRFLQLITPKGQTE